MSFVLGFIFGTVIGVMYMALCAVSKSKDIFTNADRLSADIERLAEIIYETDCFDDICRIGFDDDGEPAYLPECDNPKSCLKCIKEWLVKEAADGKDK